MAVGTPESETIVIESIQTDVAREATDSNPFTKNHWLRSLCVAFGRRVFDFHGDLNAVELRLFPDTADDETTPRWGAIYGKTKLPATGAQGNAVAIGTQGSVINIGQTITAGGNEYQTTATVTIEDSITAINSITRSGQIATVITATDHMLARNVPITITGAIEPEYNVVDTEITIIDGDSFSYIVEGSPTTPATGIAQAEHTSASVPVASNGFGQDFNLDSGTPMSPQSPIVGVNDELVVDFGEIGGGSDEESTEDLRDRTLTKIRNPVGHYNKADIIDKAKEINGNTRVFVQAAGEVVGSVSVSNLINANGVATATTAAPHGFDDGQTVTISGSNQVEYNEDNVRIILSDDSTFHYVITGSPVSPATGTISSTASIPLGMTIVYFMRDNDPNPIPSASEVEQTQNLLLEILPANTSVEDLLVKAPLAVPVDYTFTALTPDTATMRTAITANMQQFHAEQTAVGVNVDEDAYRAAIKNTVDTETGDIVQSFEISAPSGDIAITAGEIATLGSVVYP